MSTFAKIKVEDAPVIARLLDEAFPNHFTITVAIGRNEKGEVSSNGSCEIFARPRDEQEAKMVVLLASMLTVK